MPTSASSRLILLRHAHSSWALPGQRDHQRSLDDRGRREAPLVGAAFQHLGIQVDRILVSTAQRAQETIAALRPFISADAEMNSLDDLYALGPEAYIAAARHSGVASLMLVGHNPMIEEATASLAPKGDGKALETLRAGFPTAGLAVIEFAGSLADIAPGTGRLVALLAPKRI